MTTEELARRFCELVGWEIEWTGPRGLEWLHWRKNMSDNWHSVDGWAGVGVDVDEMERRGWQWVLRSGGKAAQASFGMHAAEAETPLEAVLAAAIAALEAEPGR